MATSPQSLSATGISMEELTTALSNALQRPVITAIQEQLGLKLESTKGPVEFLVIDRLERPSEN
jgi:hypothetical protein